MPSVDFLFKDGNHAKLPPGKISVESTEYGSWLASIWNCYVADPDPPRIRVLDDFGRLVLGGAATKEGCGQIVYGIAVIDNLAASPQHKATLERFRKVHHQHELAVRDLGLLPEGEMHARAGTSAPYDMGRDAKRFPAERILAAADLASSLQPGVTTRLEALMQDSDNAIRYWGVMGVLIRGKDEVAKLRTPVRRSLTDSSPHVRIAAAEALGLHGTEQDIQTVVPLLLELADSPKHGSYVAIHALNAIDALGPKALPWKSQILALPTVDPASPERVRTEYTAKLLKRIGESL